MEPLPKRVSEVIEAPMRTEPTRANAEPQVSTRGVSAWRRVREWGPWLLALSVAVRLAWAYLTPHGADLVDLHVYVSGPATLGHGNLYEFTYPDKTPDFPLPFTYPPFAAVVFWPLHLLPFTLLGLCWILGTIAGRYETD